MELPPHARRRGAQIAQESGVDGITSACAEKRCLTPPLFTGAGNYLRMRGEESSPERKIVAALELPPHARRRATVNSVDIDPSGITSACAEKRKITDLVSAIWWNYLRMRGEEEHGSKNGRQTPELPPHARRRVTTGKANTIPAGITSACAEKRQCRLSTVGNSGNYLRMRGEEW